MELIDTLNLVYKLLDKKENKKIYPSIEFRQNLSFYYLVVIK